MAERVIEVEGLRKSYGDVEAVARHRSSRRPRRGVRAARPERGRQDHDHRDPRGVSTANGGERRGPRARSRRRASRAEASASGSCCSRPASTRSSPCVKPSRCMAATTRTPAADRRGHRRRRPRPRRRDDARPIKLSRRAAAPARRRDRAGRRPGAALPRRADHRVRSERATQRVGDGQEPRDARQDGLPHDALHGRGAVPRRPGRGDRRRARSSPRDRRDARGPRPDADADPVPAAARRAGAARARAGRPDGDGSLEMRADEPTPHRCTR